MTIDYIKLGSEIAKDKSNNRIKQAIDTIDKLYILEDEKYSDYQNDYDEFKKDIPKLKKTMDMLIAVKKYLKNNADMLEGINDR